MRADFAALVADLCRDVDTILTAEQSDRALDLAVARYSEDRPHQIIEDLIASQSGTRIDLPSGYEPGFSEVQTVEFPIGEAEPSFVKFLIYQSPLGPQLDLGVSVSAGDTLRITYTARHTLSDLADTIDEQHRLAVSNFAAALCCSQLVAHYAHDTNATISADSVDHQSKSEKFNNLARRYESVYYRDLGIDKNRRPAAAAIVDLDRNLSGGGDRLFHSRRFR